MPPKRVDNKGIPYWPGTGPPPVKPSKKKQKQKQKQKQKMKQEQSGNGGSGTGSGAASASVASLSTASKGGGGGAAAAATPKSAAAAGGGGGSGGGGWTPRDLFKRIVDAKTHLVVHNGLLDLAFLYQGLHGELPPQLDTFVADVTTMFGSVTDTKYVAEFHVSVVLQRYLRGRWFVRVLFRNASIFACLTSCLCKADHAFATQPISLAPSINMLDLLCNAPG